MRLSNYLINIGFTWVSHVNDVQLVELKQKYNYLKNVKSEEHSVTEIRRFCNFTYSYFQNNASSFS